MRELDWLHGGTLITTINTCDADVFIEAIREYGDPKLYVKNGALHYSPGYRDISGFWNLFTCIEAERAHRGEEDNGNAR